jgi:hypothetical protein
MKCDPKIKTMGWFLRTFTFRRIVAITLAPAGIYFRDEKDKTSYVINHETIHWHQQLEMLIIFFYLWYLIEWIVRWFTNFGDSYHNISFEREAYGNQYDMSYLGKRKHYAWTKYLTRKQKSTSS